MHRRRFVLTSLAGALTGPLAAGAQPPRKIPRIGMLVLAAPTSGAGAAGLQAFRASLRDLGYVEGTAFTIEYRSAEGRAERLADLAAELVERHVDVIVTGGGNVSALAARKATATIPIVMSGSVSAVEAGLVHSLARPGGNVTGLTVPRELGAKQLEVLRELVPSLSRVVILLRGTLATAEQREREKALALEFLRLTLDYVEVQKPEELLRALITARAARPQAMIVAPDALFFHERQQIIDFARTAHLAVMYPFRDFVEAGGLISYSVSAAEAYRTIARYVDKILKGARPADLPVEQPATFELIINLKTAMAIGLTIPPSLLVRADQVIE